MAILTRRYQREEEEESVFVSMTDLMISILFIVMILMAFFAKSFVDQDTVSRERFDKEVSVRDEKIADLTDQNAVLTNANEQLRQRVGELESALEAKTSLVAQLLRENDILKQRLKDILASESKIRELYAAATVEIDNLKAVNARLKDENETLRARIATLEFELDGDATLEDRIAALRADNQRLREVVAALEQSRQSEERLSDTLANISETRRRLLSTIQERLLENGIKVEVDEVSGVIRFDENVIRFRSASFEPTPQVRDRMKLVADILAEELSCFTLGEFSTIDESCNQHLSIVEAIQIEGHTDAIPVRPSSSVRDNLDLSAKRAATTYREFVLHRPALSTYLNANYVLNQKDQQSIPGQPVLSVSGYAATRPVEFEDTSSARDANRRIDLRFIMTTPKDLGEAKQLVAAVQDAAQRSVGE